jgi:hypothetical protein
MEVRGLSIHHLGEGWAKPTFILHNPMRNMSQVALQDLPRATHLRNSAPQNWVLLLLSVSYPLYLCQCQSPQFLFKDWFVHSWTMI